MSIKKGFWKNNLYWILPCIAFAFFLVFISISSGLAEGLWQHILRDIGIGFLVAAIVGFMYETIARNRYDKETMEGFLTAAMGDRIGGDIWKEVEWQILEKKKAREKVFINMKVEKNPEASHQLILSVSFEYKLIGLRGKIMENQTVTHFLDAHIKQGNLPKFEFIQVGSTVYLDIDKGIDTHNVDNQGKFTCITTLEPDGENPVSVQTIRKEIVNFPGSYFLIMGDITKGISIHLATLPEDIRAFINLRPHVNNEEPLEVFKVHNYDHVMLLPGQGLEFRFKLAETPGESEKTIESHIIESREKTTEVTTAVHETKTLTIQEEQK